MTRAPPRERQPFVSSIEPASSEILFNPLAHALCCSTLDTSTRPRACRSRKKNVARSVTRACGFVCPVLKAVRRRELEAASKEKVKIVRGVATVRGIQTE